LTDTSTDRAVGAGSTAVTGEISYDPYDFDIDVDPYPVWKRMRDEAPVWHNAQYDFWALSRFDDVERCSVDWRTYRSGRGTVLELIKQGVEIPPGSILFEDPPTHDVHRSLLSRVFTPRRIAELEPKVRAFCARSLDPLVGTGGFDFIADLGAQMPMRTIGMLLGIPEEDQEAIRDRIDAGLRLEDGAPPERASLTNDDSAFGEYLDWRRQHPSDDLMTELLHAEFEDHTGVRRTLTREEILGYVGLLAGAGNETTTRLMGWTGKVLAERPDQRAKVVGDRSLVPKAIEELLRYEAPSPIQARWVQEDVEHHGQRIEAGSVVVLLTASANRDERHFPDPDRFDVERDIDHHLSFGYGIHFCLGASLARLEGRIALEEVLARFPEWDVDWDGAEQAHTSTVRGWEKLPVVVP
jgi:cytochrome P450